MLCLRLPHIFVHRYRLRSETKTRYGWVASPYPTGTFTPQDTPGFAQRDNDENNPIPNRAYTKPSNKRRSLARGLGSGLFIYSKSKVSN